MIDHSEDGELGAFIEQQIAAGHYRDRDEMVRTGLQRLRDDAQDRNPHLEQLRREIQEALDDPSPTTPLAEVFEDLRRKHERLVIATRAA